VRFLINRRLHINMGNFEHIETTATVEVDTNADAKALETLGVDPEDLGQIDDFLQERLEDLLSPDIEDAAVHTDNQDSFVLPYEKERRQQKKRGKN
jgi:hypothetical protein